MARDVCGETTSGRTPLPRRISSAQRSQGRAGCASDAEALSPRLPYAATSGASAIAGPPVRRFSPAGHAGAKDRRPAGRRPLSLRFAAYLRSRLALAILGATLGTGLLAAGAFHLTSLPGGWSDPRGCRASSNEEAHRPLLLVADIALPVEAGPPGQGTPPRNESSPALNGAALADRLIARLDAATGLAPRPFCEALTPRAGFGDGDPLAQATAEARAAGGLLDGLSTTEQANTRKADRRDRVLIWGHVDPAGETLTLRLLARGRSDDPLAGNALSRTQSLDLPLAALLSEQSATQDALGQALALLALSGLDMQASGSNGLPALLAERVEALREAARQQGGAWQALTTQTASPDAKRRIAGSLRLLEADAKRQLGLATGDRPWLVRAGTAYREGTQIFQRGGDPLLWGAAKARHAEGQLRLAEGESDGQRLEEAVAAYRAALGIFRRDLDETSWALLNSQLGAALARLGEIEVARAASARLPAQQAAEQRLLQARAALDSALEVFTPETAPLAWVETTATLARASLALGMHSGDPLAILRARDKAQEVLAHLETQPSAQGLYTTEALRRLLTAIDQLPVEMESAPQAVAD